jgi:serine protease Do
VGVYEDAWSDEPRVRVRSSWPALALAALAFLIAVGSFWRQQSAIDAAGAAEIHAQRVEHELALIQNDAVRTDARIRSTQQAISKRSANVAPLARRALRSVFTVDAGDAIGSGFVAWTNDSGSYLLTANHVVEDAGNTVTIKRGGGSWSADVVGRDRVNDIALLRADGRPAKAAPLWQAPRRLAPPTGAQLVLVGSPFGLGGTVTTGIVSRVTSKYVQTDAAANPGNSGGPAIDRDGHVVGILVMGVRDGEGLNFAVRIDRVCVHLRRCPGR